MSKTFIADKATLDSVDEKVSAILSIEKDENVYGFIEHMGTLSPGSRIEYIGLNKNFSPISITMGGGYSLGDWASFPLLVNNKPYMVKSDGTVDNELSGTDYTKKADGVTASDVADPSYGGNAMMEWGQNGKKIWYKIVPDTGDDTSASVYIADYQVDADFHAWSFINNQGALVDHFYTPCYFGTIVNDGTNDVLRSLSGRAGSTRCKNKTAAVEVQMARRKRPRNFWNRLKKEALSL